MPGIRVRVGNRFVSPMTYQRMLRKKQRSRVPRNMKKSKNPLVRLIQKVVGRNEETKYVANAPSDGAGGVLGTMWYSPGGLAGINEFYPALPALTQGTDDYQRVGNKINPTSIKVSLKIGLNPQNIEACSLLGVIYYGTDRAGRTWNNVHPLQTAGILDNGNGTNSTWTGNRADLAKPTDKKLVTLKRIVFRLSKTEGIQNADVSGATVTQGNYSTANGLSEKNFLLTFRPPKSLTYLTAADTFPQNYAPFFAVGFCHADGSALTGADEELVNVNSRVHMYFKDA